MQPRDLLSTMIQKPNYTGVTLLKLGKYTRAFYISIAEGDDLNCHTAERFNNGFIIIFQKTQKHPGLGP